MVEVEQKQQRTFRGLPCRAWVSTLGPASGSSAPEAARPNPGLGRKQHSRPAPARPEATPTEGPGDEDAPVGLDRPAGDGGIYNGKTFNQVEITP
ncbi:small ribosomal subunit protein uS19-like [Molossus nigricans]|uniref:40S ribosomal protein S15-like n=1 Tax=Molossus molossus TaxID=27622 RepID=UPI001746D401|nr:40S ribosomal protein S15-like [Molossus molossus]